MYIEHSKLGTFFKILCTLIFKTVYIRFKNYVHWMHIIVYIVCKIRHVECTELYTFFEKLFFFLNTNSCTFLVKLCILNTQNCVHYLKKFECCMYRIEKLRTFNIQIVYIIWKIVHITVYLKCRIFFFKNLHWIYKIWYIHLKKSVNKIGRIVYNFLNIV